MRISDWSSDVCSSDLARIARAAGDDEEVEGARDSRGRADAHRAAAVREPRDQRRRRLRRRVAAGLGRRGRRRRSEEHTSELQSLMRISYAVFCLKKKNVTKQMTIKTPKYNNATPLPHTTTQHKTTH